MAYINNLIAWGDNLFTQDTLETINQATQLYVLAASLLGPRPQVVPPRVRAADKTYADLEGSFDDFSNSLVAAENVIPPVRVNVPTPPGAQSMPIIETLYFRIPSNSQLLTAWDTIADRLYKIRNCMNIQGVVQQLGLFAPAINPGALVAAAAAGLDLGSAINDLSAATPPYRFSVMIREATQLANEVVELGSSLLQALEKRDAEQLATIRSSGEIRLQKAVDDFRNREIDEANAQITALSAAKNVFNDRLSFYKGRAIMNTWEATALIAHGASLIPQAIGIALETTAAVGHAVPAAQFGGSGFGGTPHVSAVYGGQNVGHASNSGAKAARIAAAVLQTTGLVSGTLGSYHQRQDDWNLQATLATDDLGRLNAEIATATIRRTWRPSKRPPKTSRSKTPKTSMRICALSSRTRNSTTGWSARSARRTSKPINSRTPWRRRPNSATAASSPSPTAALCNSGIGTACGKGSPPASSSATTYVASKARTTPKTRANLSSRSTSRSCNSIRMLLSSSATREHV